MTDEEYTRKTFESHVHPTAGRVEIDAGEMDERYAAGFQAAMEYAEWSQGRTTVEEAALVRRVLALTGRTAPMHERHQAREIVDRFLPAFDNRHAGRGMPLAFGDAANC